MELRVRVSHKISILSFDAPKIWILFTFKITLCMSRQIIFYGNHFMDFYSRQDKKVQEKIQYVFQMIQSVEKVPEKFLKHLTGTDGLYEIRIEVRSDIFRVFCCFDKGKLVVLFNGFQKKTQKTPSGELDKAVKLMKAYFNTKDI